MMNELEMNVYQNPILNNLYKEFTCAICLHLFKDPVTVSCKHTYCHDCLKQWKIKSNQSNSKTFKCPLCKNVTTNRACYSNDKFALSVKFLIELNDYMESRRKSDCSLKFLQHNECRKDILEKYLDECIKYKLYYENDGREKIYLNNNSIIANKENNPRNIDGDDQLITESEENDFILNICSTAENINIIKKLENDFIEDLEKETNTKTPKEDMTKKVKNNNANVTDTSSPLTMNKTDSSKKSGWSRMKTINRDINKKTVKYKRLKVTETKPKIEKPSNNRTILGDFDEYVEEKKKTSKNTSIVRSTNSEKSVSIIEDYVDADKKQLNQNDDDEDDDVFARSTQILNLDNVNPDVSFINLGKRKSDDFKNEEIIKKQKTPDKNQNNVIVTQADVHHSNDSVVNFSTRSESKQSSVDIIESSGETIKERSFTNPKRGSSADKENIRATSVKNPEDPTILNLSKEFKETLKKVSELKSSVQQSIEQNLKESDNILSGYSNLMYNSDSLFSSDSFERNSKKNETKAKTKTQLSNACSAPTLNATSKESVTFYNTAIPCLEKIRVYYEQLKVLSDQFTEYSTVPTENNSHKNKVFANIEIQTDILKCPTCTYTFNLKSSENTFSKESESKTLKRKSDSKSPRRESGSKTPRRESGSKTPRRKSDSKSPIRESGSKTPRRDSDSKSPRRESGSKTPRKRESGSKSPKRESGSKTPRRRESGSKSPRRESGSKTPRRESGSKSPRRELGSKTPRTRESGSKSPRRESGSKTHRRESDSKSPRRESGSKTLRRRESGSKSPGRESDSKTPRRESDSSKSSRKASDSSKSSRKASDSSKTSRKESKSRTSRIESESKTSRKESEPKTPRKESTSNKPRIENDSNSEDLNPFLEDIKKNLSKDQPKDKLPKIAEENTNKKRFKRIRTLTESDSDESSETSKRSKNNSYQSKLLYRDDIDVCFHSSTSQMYSNNIINNNKTVENNTTPVKINNSSEDTLLYLEQQYKNPINLPLNSTSVVAAEVVPEKCATNTSVLNLLSGIDVSAFENDFTNNKNNNVPEKHESNQKTTELSASLFTETQVNKLNISVNHLDQKQSNETTKTNAAADADVININDMFDGDSIVEDSCESDEIFEDDIVDTTPQKSIDKRVNETEMKQKNLSHSKLELLKLQNQIPTKINTNTTSMTPDFLPLSNIDLNRGFFNNSQSTQTQLQQSNRNAVALDNDVVESSMNLKPLLLVQNDGCSPLQLVKQQNHVGKTKPDAAKHQSSILSYVTPQSQTNISHTANSGVVERSGSPVLRSRLSPAPAPLILCTSRLKSKENSDVMTYVSRLNAKYTNVFNKSVTHLIVSVDENNCVIDQTIKYVLAIAHGIWIIPYSWFRDSIHNNRFLSEEPYEVLDMSGIPGPRLSRLRRKEYPLFRDFVFYLAQPIRTASKAELEDVITNLGGQIIKIENGFKKNPGKCYLILSEGKCLENNEQYEILKDKYKVMVADIEWLSETVGQYKITSIRPYALCSDENIEICGYPPELIAPIPESQNDTLCDHVLD